MCEFQTNFSIFVVSREWPGHQVLLVLTDFFIFSRNDFTGSASGRLRERHPLSLHLRARFFLKKKKMCEF